MGSLTGSSEPPSPSPQLGSGAMRAIVTVVCIWFQPFAFLGSGGCGADCDVTRPSGLISLVDRRKIVPGFVETTVDHPVLDRMYGRGGVLLNWWAWCPCAQRRSLHIIFGTGLFGLGISLAVSALTHAAVAAVPDTCAGAWPQWQGMATGTKPRDRSGGRQRAGHKSAVSRRRTR